jgi:dienelactone hydrolase
MRIFATLILGLVMLCISSVEVNAVERGYVPEVGRVVRPNMVVVAEEDRGDYVCKMVEFSVDDTYTDSRGRKIRSKERINGYLLVPDVAEKGKCPALVMLHDHGARFDIGKEKLVRPIADILPEGVDDHIYRSSRQWIDKNFDGVYVADSLASLGYVILVTDALYWGERSSDEAQRWSELNYARMGDESYEVDRTLTGKPRKDTIKALKIRVYGGQRKVYSELRNKKIIWAEKILRDDIASVNLLAGLPYVDSKNIGAFGFSMGAHRCWLLSAFCDKVKCGVSLSWMTAMEGYEGNNDSDLSMRIQPMRDYLDFGDIAKFLAPKPMLFLNGESDHLFPKGLVQIAFDKMKAHYEAYEKVSGIPSAKYLDTEFFDGGHHCGKNEQATIVSFFRKYLPQQ